MKRSTRFGAFAILTVLSLGACSLERYSSLPTADVSIDLSNRTSAAPDIGQYDFNCVLVDVRGPGIEPLFAPSSPYDVMDLGYTSTWMSLPKIAASSQRTVKVSVPLGRSRLVRLLGVKLATPPAECESLTFKGHPHSGVLASSPLPTMIAEIGRATIDVLGAKSAVMTLSSYAVTLVPAGTQLAVTPTHELITANADSTFSEGSPPTSGAFSTFSANPPPFSYQSMAGRARYDVVVPVTPGSIAVQPPFVGLQLDMIVEAGEVSCSGAEPRTITTKTPVSVGLWSESDKTWKAKPNALPALEQDLVRTVRFSGFDMKDARFAVNAGGAIEALYLSLRVPELPSTGCSTIRIKSLSAVLYK